MNPELPLLSLGSLEGSEKSYVKQRMMTPSDVSIPEIDKRIHKPIELRPITPSMEQLHGVIANINPKAVLDGFALLEATGVGFPHDARQANLSGRGYCAVVPEDMLFFSGLVYLDVSENQLPFESFANLPRLKELRMACNNISMIQPSAMLFEGYQRLLYLDLSYNRLQPISLCCLYTIPRLLELDLTGNGLKALPEDFYRLQSLEKLYLSRNKFQDNNVWYLLCGLYQLRHVDLSYNFLTQVPSLTESSLSDPFRVLSSVDVSFNYLSREEDVQALAHCPRLESVILYGNPLLGPTGEDVMKMYIESLVEYAMDCRSDAAHQGDIEVRRALSLSRCMTRGVCVCSGSRRFLGSVGRCCRKALRWGGRRCTALSPCSPSRKTKANGSRRVSGSSTGSERSSERRWRSR